MQMTKLMRQLLPILFPVRIEEARNTESESPNIDYTFNNDIDHWVVGDLKEGPKVLNACSKGYHLVKNEDLFKPILAKLEERFPGKIEIIVKHYRNSKFYVDYIIKDVALQVMKGDLLFARLRGVNSYDGSITFRFSLGFFRPFCENQININTEILELDEDEEMEDFGLTVRHTVSAEQAVKDALTALDSFIEIAPKFKQVYKTMVKKEYAQESAKKRLEKVAKAAKYPPKSLEYAYAQLDREAEKFALNDYIIYNCLNFGLYSNPNSKMKDHKKDKVDLRVLDYLLTN